MLDLNLRLAVILTKCLAGTMSGFLSIAAMS